MKEVNVKYQEILVLYTKRLIKKYLLWKNVIHLNFNGLF